MLNRAHILLPLLMLSMLMTGCNKAIAPTFRAVGVQEVERNGDRSTINFIVEASNPNKEPIPLRQVRYRIDLDGQEVFAGVRSPERTLHTYDTATFSLPAVINFSEISSQRLIEYRLVGTVQYIPPGRLSEVLFDAELKVPEAVIDINGSIDTGAVEPDDSSDTES